MEKAANVTPPVIIRSAFVPVSTIENKVFVPSLKVKVPEFAMLILVVVSLKYRLLSHPDPICNPLSNAEPPVIFAMLIPSTVSWSEEDEVMLMLSPALVSAESASSS